MDVHVLPADWAADREVLRAIRGAVFIEEQGVPQEVEWDDQDAAAQHFLAIDQAGRRVGCGRLLPSGQIGRMAVLAEHRGRGIGRLILDTALEAARQQGLTRVFLHAQTAVVPFYARAGFLADGGEFMEAGIPHQAMSLALPIPFEADPSVPKPVIRQAQAPEDSTGPPREHAGETDCLEGIRDIVAQASRTIRIYSQELDHMLFDRPDLISTLSEFVRHGAPARLQVLVHSSGSMVSRGHGLLDLARRLDSKIRIRRVPVELASDRHSCVLADERGYWLMPDHLDYHALSNRFDPVQATRLAERFDYLWNRSETDPELRILRI
jgi:predicted GNAT family N-acyltransferase